MLNNLGDSIPPCFIPFNCHQAKNIRMDGQSPHYTLTPTVRIAAIDQVILMHDSVGIGGGYGTYELAIPLLAVPLLEIPDLTFDIDTISHRVVFFKDPG